MASCKSRFCWLSAQCMCERQSSCLYKSAAEQVRFFISRGNMPSCESNAFSYYIRILMMHIFLMSTYPHVHPAICVRCLAIMHLEKLFLWYYHSPLRVNAQKKPWSTILWLQGGSICTVFHLSSHEAQICDIFSAQPFLSLSSSSRPWIVGCR